MWDNVIGIMIRMYEWVHAKIKNYSKYFTYILFKESFNSLCDTNTGVTKSNYHFIRQ
jgi:hypothetical protein